MPKPRKALDAGHVHHLGTGSVDHLTILSSLWRLFERSGAVSAYIAYRLQLSRVVREAPLSADDLSFIQRSR